MAESAAQAPRYLELEMVWHPNDNIEGFYLVDIEVGEPPQGMRLVHDRGSSDLAVHLTADDGYLDACSIETPLDLCFPQYDNANSSTYEEMVYNAYRVDFGESVLNGSYIRETVRIGGVAVRNQDMASVYHSTLAVGLMGTSFPASEVGEQHGTYPEYPTWQQRMVSQGSIRSATQSIWLDPASTDPNAFTHRSAVFGALDRSLFSPGELVTLPVVEPANTSVSTRPLNWNTAISAVARTTDADGPGINFVQDPAGHSCVLDTGTAFFALPDASFARLVASFPDAVLNDSLPGQPPFYQMPCSARRDSATGLTFTWFDPAADPFPGGAPGTPSPALEIVVPPEMVVWPADRVAPGGDPATCALAAYSWESYFGGTRVDEKYECVLGVNVMKQIYAVLDLENRQVSMAPARASGDGASDLVEIPAGGVTVMGGI